MDKEQVQFELLTMKTELEVLLKRVDMLGRMVLG